MDAGLKNPNGQGVREVLIDIFNEFPSYDLQPKKGYKAAIQDIESRLGAIASFEGLEHCSK
jgi:hypothetical protein